MVAAAVMGIIVSIALPRYRVFIARGRMSEAKANLGVLATLQQSYHAIYGSHGKISVANKVGGGGVNGSCTECTATTNNNKGLCNELGFRPSDCTRMRYFYYSSSSTSTANANGNVAAGLDEIYPNCQNNNNIYDKWVISNKERDLEHSVSVIKRCHK